MCRHEQTGPSGDTTPVFAHADGVSSFGTFQQSGNLWEWCEDVYEENAYKRYAEGDFTEPTGYESRVLRGDSWFNYDPRDLRGGVRGTYDPKDRYDVSGFRIARTITF